MTIEDMTIEINKLTEHTGSEITGVDLGKPLEPELLAKIKEEFAKRSVLVFRNQSLNPQEFLSALQQFGEIMPQGVSRFTLPELPLVGFVSSEDTDKPGGVRMVRGEQFHTDHSNFPAPPIATVLKAVELPSKGGDTRFVNMHASYDDLPDEIKKKIDGLRALHVFKSSRSPRKKAELSEEEKKRMPEMTQPLVIRHPGNGRKAPYLNTAHIEKIIDMDDEEAFDLIGKLMDHCTQSKYEYRHVWKANDLVMWDNRSVMHSATADYDPSEKRFLYRIMLAGSPLTPAA